MIINKKRMKDNNHNLTIDFHQVKFFFFFEIVIYKVIIFNVTIKFFFMISIILCAVRRIFV